MRTEEAVKPVVPRGPYTPTAQERAEHEPTHLPFRSWCKQCVEGRLENNPHPHELQREHAVPTVLMDCGFVSKAGDEKCLALLVTKDRYSRVLQVDVVLHEG